MLELNGRFMKNPEISSDLVVADVLERWPETIPVFLRHHMGCVGCALAPFDTVLDAATIYHIGVEIFVNELRAAVRGKRNNTQYGIRNTN
jgi:hybrid cluster-associated redox disulfide protein